jgi:hypothetical protein
MRTSTRTRGLTAALLTALIASACSSMGDDPSALNGKGDGTEGNGANGPNGGSNADGSDPNVPVDCDVTGEQPGPRQLRLLTREEYAATVSSLLGIPKPAVDNLPVESKVAGFDNNSDAAVVTSRHIDEYLSLGDSLARQALTANRAGFIGCDATQPTCAKTFVEKLGKKAFRRPLSAEESARYTALFAPTLTNGSFDDGVIMASQAILASPSFLYRSEVGEAQPDGTFKLTPYEIATALSYTFWGTPPDDALMAAADSGKLANPTEIDAQANRLLMDPKARPRMAAFFGQWFDTTALLSANKDAAIYPKFNDAVRQSMAKEEDTFFTSVLYEGTHTFGELFNADYVYLDNNLSSFYGIPGGGQTMTKVPVPADSPRGGVLTLGAVLAAQAHPNESSPVKRGVFIRRHVLCQDLTPPPPTLDTTPPGLDPNLTTRERFAKHTSSPACAGCHQYIDGVGFGFERFDGVGQYRAQENGKDVDASGQLVGKEALNDGSNLKFVGPRELGKMLATSEAAQSCAATQYFRYSRGLQEKGVDVCATKTLAASFKKGGLDLRQLFLSFAQQKSFLVRRAGTPGVK